LLSRASPNLRVIALRAVAQCVGPKIRGGPLEQAFPSVRHESFFI